MLHGTAMRLNGYMGAGAIEWHLMCGCTHRSCGVAHFLIGVWVYCCMRPIMANLQLVIL